MVNLSPGQSTLEYIIILCVIILAIFVGANTVMRSALEERLNHLASDIRNATHPPSVDDAP